MEKKIWTKLKKNSPDACKELNAFKHWAHMQCNSVSQLTTNSAEMINIITEVEIGQYFVLIIFFFSFLFILNFFLLIQMEEYIWIGRTLIIGIIVHSLICVSAL